jgi:predicted small secreted protein
MRSVVVPGTSAAEVRRVVGVSMALIGAGVLLIYLAGCNTFKGVGRDIEAVAQGGQDVIDGKR